MTANDLWFVVGSTAATGSSVSAARKGAHTRRTRGALSPLLEGSSSSSSNQRCRSRLYKSFQDATDHSFMHLLPALFETPPPPAGNVPPAPTLLSHETHRFKKKKKKKKALLNISRGFLSSHACQPVRTSTQELSHKRVPGRAGGCSRAQAAQTSERGCTGVTPHGVVRVREKRKEKKRKERAGFSQSSPSK